MVRLLFARGMTMRVVAIGVLLLLLAAVPAEAAPLAEGPRTTWFFAEGSTQPPFDTWFLLQNQNAQTVTVTFTFFLQSSGVVTRSFVVGPTSRFSVFANQIIPNQAFSTRLDASAPIFAERAMYVSYDGDVVTGIPAPSTTWLLAEGSTQSPFQTWLLLENPNATAATATVTYLLEDGRNVTQVQPLAPNSRTSIFVNQVLPNVGFSTRVQSDQPIIAERAMYRFPGNAATVNTGVNTAAASWFFADGRTTFGNQPADTFLLVQNPNAAPVTLTVTLFNTTGATTTFVAGVPARARRTIFLNTFMTGSFGIQVMASAPVIAERSVFFGVSPTLGAYSTQGATTLSTGWNFAEGDTLSPFDELLTILNPQSATMSVRIDFHLSNGQVVPAFFNVNPHSKLEVEVGRIVTGANSARVTTSLPSVVERTMRIFKLGVVGAHDTIGFANP